MQDVFMVCNREAIADTTNTLCYRSSTHTTAPHARGDTNTRRHRRHYGNTRTFAVVGNGLSRLSPLALMLRLRRGEASGSAADGTYAGVVPSPGDPNNGISAAPPMLLRRGSNGDPCGLQGDIHTHVSWWQPQTLPRCYSHARWQGADGAAVPPARGTHTNTAQRQQHTPTRCGTKPTAQPPPTHPLVRTTAALLLLWLPVSLVLYRSAYEPPAPRGVYVLPTPVGGDASPAPVSAPPPSRPT